mmetsp:Transcript_11133/g.31553  ORF Transcript_11133/g.31553 Transcript_11133/m.31553 type:complete len:127 (-) Transcript_11133:618-998(-)
MRYASTSSSISVVHGVSRCAAAPRAPPATFPSAVSSGGHGARRSTRGSLTQVLASATPPPEKGSSSADAFLSSPVGKAVSWLGNSITSSKLNEGKIKLAMFQAGDYDEEAVSAKVSLEPASPLNYA